MLRHDDDPKIGGPSTKLVAVGSLIAGMALCALSWWLNEGSETWWASVLVNLGTAVLVFAPLYWATRILDLRLQEARQQAEDLVHGVSERLDDISSDQGRQLALLTAELKLRRSQADRQVADVTARLRDDPTRESLTTFHSYMLAAGLLRASPHARVECAPGIYLQVPASYRYSDPVFRIATLDGRQLAAVSWGADLTAPQFWEALSSKFEGITSAALDIERFLNAYTRLVELAASHQNLRGAVCLFEPQWMLCRLGLVPVDRPLEALVGEKMRDSEARTALKRNDWVDVPSFEAALAAVDAGMHG